MDGFVLIGMDTATCMSTGEWSYPTPFCVCKYIFMYHNLFNKCSSTYVYMHSLYTICIHLAFSPCVHNISLNGNQAIYPCNHYKYVHVSIYSFIHFIYLFIYSFINLIMCLFVIIHI